MSWAFQPLPAAVSGPIDVVRSTQAVGAGPVTSVSVSFVSLPAAGNAIVVQVSAFESTGYNALVAGDCTDNQGNTYSLAYVQEDGAAGGASSSVACFYCESIGAPSGTFTVTVARPGTNDWYARVAAHEVAGGVEFDAATTASGTSNAPTVTSATPASADSIIFGSLSTDDGSTDTGIDYRQGWNTDWLDNNGTAVVSSMAAHKTLSSAAAQTFNGGTLAASENWAIGVAIFSIPSVTNYDLVVDKGDLVLTGRNVAFSVDLPVAKGDLTLTGQSVALEAGFNLPLTKADLTLSGQNVNFALDFPVSKGDLALSGQNIALEAGFVLPVTKGDLALTGQSVGFALDLPIAKGDLTLTGQSIALEAGFNLPVSKADLALTGGSVGFNVSLPVTAPTLALTGGTLALEIALPITAGALALTGGAIGTSVTLPVGKGDLTLAGQDVPLDFSSDIQLSIDAGHLILTGGEVGFLTDFPATEEATPGVVAQQWAEAIRRYKAELEAEERAKDAREAPAANSHDVDANARAAPLSAESALVKQAAALAVEQGIKPDAKIVAMAFAIAQERAAAYVVALQQEMALIEEEETIFMLIAASAGAGASI